MKSEKSTIYGMLPEEILSVSRDAPPGVPLDGITAACSRAESVLHLLMVQFNSGPDAERLSDSVIANVLWDVQGTLGLIRAMAYHGNSTSTPTNQKVRT